MGYPRKLGLVDPAPRRFSICHGAIVGKTHHGLCNGISVFLKMLDKPWHYHVDLNVDNVMSRNSGLDHAALRHGVLKLTYLVDKPGFEAIIAYEDSPFSHITQHGLDVHASVSRNIVHKKRIILVDDTLDIRPVIWFKGPSLMTYDLVFASVDVCLRYTLIFIEL